MSPILPHVPSRPLRFWHRHAVVEVADPAPTRTVLEWLREDAHCTGTKEGCAEGDCGACTVVLGELRADGSLLLKPVNACIQFLPTLDGKALFAVEDIATNRSARTGQMLHPVQQCMVDKHASQCGFCTPGFVMSLWASYENHHQAGSVPSRQRLADELSGNLCRCTGYRPILDAGQAMFEVPPQRLKRAPVVAALQALQAAPPLHLPGFHAPRTLAEFAALRAAEPQACVLAGSTDIGLWVNKRFRNLGTLISINEVAELKTVVVDDKRITIGAAVSLEDAFAALAAEWPTLQEVWLRFASLPIRHAGTMGGNVANGSPIGDCAPLLIALGATIVLRQGERVRRMALEDFYVDYMKNRLEAGEFVQALEVPRCGAQAQGRMHGRMQGPMQGPKQAHLQAHLQGPTHALRVYKISKRFDCDISAVCAALALEVSGDLVTSARIVYGGMAATVRRAPLAEAALVGRAWIEATVQSAMAALAHDYTPLGDMRASSVYRMQVAQNLLRRFWLETRPVDALPTSAVSVWARGQPA